MNNMLVMITMTIFMHWTWQTTMPVMLTNEKELLFLVNPPHLHFQHSL